MAEEKIKDLKDYVKCTNEWQEFINRVADWIEAQRVLIEAPDEKKLEEVARIYIDAIEKGKKFAQCEFK